MNWPLNAQPSGAFYDRQVFHQSMHQMLGLYCNDDVWTLNPQSSSQWDGLRHFGYCREKMFYGGVTMEDVYAADGNGKKSTVLGIQGEKSIQERGSMLIRVSLKGWQEKGIVGRGVLIDYHSWRLEKGIEYDAFSSTPIPLEHLEECLKAQRTEIKFGDILFTRTGMYNTLSNDYLFTQLTQLRLYASTHGQIRNRVRTPSPPTPSFCWR